MKILYVEDNLTNVSLVKRVARGHTLISYVDGEEALRHFPQDDPDLVLMDVQLAGKMTGLDVVRKLRSDGVKVPIIAVTAYAMLGDRESCLQAGCDDYIAKPLPIPKLVEIIQTREKILKDSQPEAKPEPESEKKEPTPAAKSEPVVMTPVRNDKKPDVTVEEPKAEPKPMTAPVESSEKPKDEASKPEAEAQAKVSVEPAEPVDAKETPEKEEETAVLDDEKPDKNVISTAELQGEAVKAEKQSENPPEAVVQSNKHETKQ